MASARCTATASFVCEKTRGPPWRAQSVMAVARSPGAQLGQFRIHFRLRDRAAFNIDQAMGVMPVEPDDAVLDMDGDAVAIFVIERRRHDRSQGRLAEFADALEGLFHLARFPVELVLVLHVLVTAPAAAPEIRTARLNPMRRGFPHPHEFGLGEGFFLSHDLSGDVFAFDRERNEDRLAIGAPDAFAAKGDVVDDQVHFALHP